MMNFFKALREKTLVREQDRVGRSVYLSAGVQRGIDATIEALKEMVVGEPIPMNLSLFHRSEAQVYTLLYDKNDELHARWIGKHGTDGEEVVVMVFRVDKEKD